MKSFWRVSGGFLAKVWRVSGRFLAGFWRVLTERKRISTEIRDGHALEAFRLLGRHALVTFEAILDQFVEGSRSGHPEAAFGLLWRHALVTFRAVLSGFRSSCPKYAKKRGVTKATPALLQEAWRDRSVPWKPRAQRDQTVPRAGAVTEVCRQCSSARGPL